jgi:hypothetical protein
VSQARFQKQQREKARQEKAAAKRNRKAARAESADGDADQAEVAPQERVLADLAALHARFEDGGMDFDEFEELKRDLLAQLDV